MMISNSVVAGQQNENATYDNDIFSTTQSIGFSADEHTSSGLLEEVRVVNKWSETDTKRIRIVRLLVLTVIGAAAVAVAVTTYQFLKEAEEDDFKNAFAQFGATLATSALDQQIALRQAYRTLAEFASADSQESNASWPYYSMPHSQSYISKLRRQARIELLVLLKHVEPDQLEEYAAWVDTVYEMAVAESHVLEPGHDFDPFGYVPFVWKFENETTKVFDNTSDFYYVMSLERSPPRTDYRSINMNIATVPSYANMYRASEILRNEIVYGEVRPLILPEEAHNKLHSLLPGQSAINHPHSCVSTTILEEVDNIESPVVGMLHGCMAWDAPLRNLLPAEIAGISVTISNTCNQSYTYLVEGPEAYFLGDGDLHDHEYDKYRMQVEFSSLFNNPDLFLSTPGHCIYDLTIYPTAEFEKGYVSNTPETFVIIITVTFLFMIVVFVVYDVLVQRRNRKLVTNAAQSNAFVSSMFPSNIRDRLLPGFPIEEDSKKITRLTFSNNRGQMKDFLDGGDASGMQKPIADLFPETTIMFADITDFTAWSSVREPTHVFTLLEIVFSEMDRIAKKRGVFKVETVGDCYVAVVGLPEPTKDHAVIMARFANETLRSVPLLLRKLELSLGPDTGDLGIRIGLHSGVVTGGVLRGERPRFQLFGDTVNTTARIESSGERNRIHISKETADFLINAGKEHWLVPRHGIVTAKGKGALQTFWLQIDNNTAVGGAVCEDAIYEEESEWAGAEVVAVASKTDRLIDWQVDVCTRLLKQVVARRSAISDELSVQKESDKPTRPVLMRPGHQPGATCLDEVKEIITLPEFDRTAARNQVDPNSIELGKGIMQQLRRYIGDVALKYRKNHFHNFEHACHVTMSVTKLLSRIVAPSDILDSLIGDERDQSHALDGANGNVPDENKVQWNIASTLHDHTYGITSDPLTQLSLVLSALIHDVDHSGVPNTALIEENQSLAVKYRSKSVAEQNSIDIAWNLLHEEQFRDLLSCICSTQAEYDRFRQLVVQAVLATDIADKELKVLRNARWENAFAETAAPDEENPRDTVNRKATIVIEHLIQASDVAHTMQHWYVYRKWNEKFFRECYQAYLDGRAGDTDPSLGWYKGELGFFDFYIIPLACKLKKCGVFGVSSDEYLNYALKNRQEWEDRGREVVEDMVQTIMAEAVIEPKQ